jgi:meso-butanediol dehydrogenase / (S,S)-butanediol dehydrogenase / diacetyl reductase
MSKVAMITGGAQGIGAEIARHLSKKGFDIAVADLQQQEPKAQDIVAEVESAGQKAVFIPVDVTDQAGVAKAVNDAAIQLGGFDVMVNNAGVAKVDKFEDINPMTSN